ncbi:hypothetical protein FAI40_01415 [Acetobacteraceae bacterium]|nr:hypothetical protein FAI40_01415 [Acetobacteraceae bacterium]
MKLSDYSHNLWKRAPLWRWSLIGSVSFLLMTTIFPSEGLQKLLPFLKGHYPTEEKTDQTNNPSPAGPQAFSFHISPLNSDKTVFGKITIAGRDFPLPQGAWHPILAASSQNDLSLTSFLREKDGKVTGFLTILSTLRPIPSFMIPHIEEVKEKCHDDRIAAHWNAPSYHDTKINCAFLEPVSPMNDRSIMNDPFLDASLSRIVNDLAFELPSIMISREWLKLKKIPGRGRVFENVEFWEVPASNQISPQSMGWNQFFTKLSQELPAWAKRLSDAFDADLTDLPENTTEGNAPNKTPAEKLPPQPPALSTKQQAVQA